MQNVLHLPRYVGQALRPITRVLPVKPGYEILLVLEHYRVITCESHVATCFSSILSCPIFLDNGYIERAYVYLIMSENGMR